MFHVEINIKSIHHEDDWLYTILTLYPVYPDSQRGAPIGVYIRIRYSIQRCIPRNRNVERVLTREISSYAICYVIVTTPY